MEVYFFKGIKNPCVLEEIVYPIYYIIFKEKLSSTIPSNLYLDFYNKILIYILIKAIGVSLVI